MTDNYTSPEQLLAEDTEKSQALTTAANAVIEGQLEANQLIGRVQAALAISDWLSVTMLVRLKEIKAEKEYRKLKGQTITVSGTVYRLDTWEGYCQGVGSSRRAIDEKLQNLQLLGERALENAQNLDMTTRELRKLRKLDPGDQNVIIGELEASIGDKDAIVELIENMSAKHVKDKAELQAKIDEEKQETETQKRIVQQKNKKIDELDEQIVKQENITLDDKIKTAYKDLSEMQTTAIEQVKQVRALVENAMSLEDKGIEHTVTAMMLNIRNELDDIIVAFDLEYVELNRAIDDSWIGEHEEQPELPIGLAPDEGDDEVISVDEGA